MIRPAGQKVLIVGAGPGGLAAAMLLAAAGAEVTVLERQPHVGGRTSTLHARTDHGTFRFDRGPTFFLYPQVLREIFAACGERLDDHVELIRLDPQYHLVFEGRGEVKATPHLARMQRELARLSPRDAQQLPRFLAENRKKFDAMRPILQRPFHGWRDLLSPDLLKLGPTVRPWASVDRELKRYFQDPAVRLAFSFQSKYLGMSPFRCPGLFTILSYLEYDYGVYHPVGGCGAVSEAMASLARKMGVKIHLDTPVRELLTEGRRAVGAKTDHATHRADAVVVNADFAHAMHKLIPDAKRRKYTDAKLAKKKYSCSTYMMYLGLRGPCDELEHHTIFLARDYARNLREIEHDHVLSENPSVYVQNATRTEPGLAPPGMSALYVLAPVTHDHANVDWADRQPAFDAAVRRQLAKLGLKNLDDRIVYRKTFTPVDWRDQMGIYRGATFNLAHTLRQMLHFRPRNRFEEFDGMYLVGGGTHPGSGLPVIYEGARITAELVREDLGLPPTPGSITPAPGSVAPGSVAPGSVAVNEPTAERIRTRADAPIPVTAAEDRA